jgi:hypothetical protein
MLVDRLKTPLRFPARAAALITALQLALAMPIVAQGTHLWSQTRLEDFEKGTPQGVAIGSNGNLSQGPGLTDAFTTPSTFVWSLAVDKSGTSYVGTGSPALVLRGSADKAAKPFTLFETKDLSVQVVRVAPDGSLYAATVPSGKVYKLNAGSTAKQDEASAAVVFDSSKLDPEGVNVDSGGADQKSAEARARYIWDMTFDSTGRLYIATGGPGMIYRIDPARAGARPEVFFKSDEQHVRSLAWDAKGNLIAGTDGSGLVYRISPQGKSYVLFEAPRREITSVAVGMNGTIFAASVGDKSRNPLPPLPVQGVGTVTFTIVQPGSLQAVNASASAPEGTEIYALTEGQAPRKVWTGKEEIVYALAARPDGVLALSGNRGRIFLIKDDGDFADIAHVEAQQGLSLAIPTGENDVLIGTGNTGKVYRLGKVEKHEYASDILDATAYARFGRVEVDPGSEKYEIFTRTGNVEQPIRGRGDWGWTDWQPVKDGAVASPPGRFLQWKAVLSSGGKIGSVGVNYLPLNAAPVMDDLVVATGARLNPLAAASAQQPTVNISFPSSAQNATPVFDASANAPLAALKDRAAITVRWAAHDDNGDDLTYSLYLRGDGEQEWRLLKDGITDKAYTFDATQIPDGGYEVKIVASDAPSHSPGDALTGTKQSERFEVDTTPPVVSALKATGAQDGTARVTFDADDATSPVAHAEYSIDAGPWQYIDPVGGLSDAKHEHYDIQIPKKTLESKTGEHLVTVRAYDRHENIGVAKTVFGQAK